MKKLTTILAAALLFLLFLPFFADANEVNPVIRKMRSIVIPEVKIDNAEPLAVIRYLIDNSKKYDPDGVGVSISASFRQGAAGQIPRFSLQGTKMTLGEVMQQFLKSTGLRARLDGETVILYHGRPPAPPRQSRPAGSIRPAGKPVTGELTPRETLRAINLSSVRFNEVDAGTVVKTLNFRLREMPGVQYQLVADFDEIEADLPPFSIEARDITLEEVLRRFCRASQLQYLATTKQATLRPKDAFLLQSLGRRDPLITRSGIDLATLQALRNLTISELNFDNAPLGSIIDFLNADTKKRAPDGAIAVFAAGPGVDPAQRITMHTGQQSLYSSLKELCAKGNLTYRHEADQKRLLLIPAR